MWGRRKREKMRGLIETERERESVCVCKIGGKFAPLTIMNSEDTDMDTMISTFNTALTETASEILGKT